MTTLEPAEIAEPYCYLTTTGRVSGKPHTIEIWFGHTDEHPGTIYLMSGGRDGSDWVRNLLREPAVGVRIGEREFAAHARVAEGTDEDPTARALLFAKYQDGYEKDLTSWRDTSLPVAIDLR